MLSWEPKDKGIGRFTKSRFKKIVVVGPQRSGTRFTTWVLSEDLGYTFIDQKGIGLANWSRLLGQLDNHVKVVIQGTGCTHKIHELGRDDTLVVWVVRNPDEIDASEKRIRWGAHNLEAGKLPENWWDRQNELLCQARYRYWTEVQRDQLPHWLEIRYDDLKHHHLYMPKEERDKLRGGKGMEWNSCGEKKEKPSKDEGICGDIHSSPRLRESFQEAVGRVQKS